MFRFALSATLLVFLGISQIALSQAKLQGRITDDQGNPMPSATVTTTDGAGVFSDLDGMYTLELSAGEHTVTYGFIGFLSTKKKITLRANETKTLNIRLREDAVMLNESIVVGYGVQRKKEVTGAISTIDSKDITAVQTPSFEAALQGQAAGVQVTQGSGMAGSGSVIRIRGLSSLSAGGDPLYVVDGIPINQGYFVGPGTNSGGMNRNPLASFNPNDIKSVEVLKDAAATGIYGSRGANGVILITTKRGTRKGLQVSYRSSYGAGRPTARPNMLNTEEYLTIRQEAWENDGGTGYVWLPHTGTSALSSPEARKLAYERALQTDTDWWDVFTRTSQKIEQNLSFRSGGKKWSMFNSVSISDNESYAVGNSYNRQTVKTNFDWIPSNKLKLSVQGSLAKGENNRVGAAWDGGIGAAMSTALPYMAPYVNDTTFDDNGVIQSVDRDYELDRWWNPLAIYNNKLFRETERRRLLTGQLTYSPFRGLDIVANAGFDQSLLEGDEFIAADFYEAQNIPNAVSSGNWSQGVQDNLNLGTNATYRIREDDETRLSVMVGFESQRFKRSGNSVGIRNTNGPAYQDVALRDSLFSLLDSTISDSVSFNLNGPFPWDNSYNAFVSTFARVNYAWRDRIYVQGTARVDASTRFGRNYRNGFFPSVSLGYVVSDEDWFQSEIISFLKIRTSAGRTGNADIPDNSRFEVWTPIGFNQTYSGTPIVYPNKPGNDDLRWETATTLDAALELGLWDDRVAIEAGVYRKQGAGVLIDALLPSHIPFNSYMVNTAEILNQGIELSITSNNLDGAFRWKTTLNHSYNYNELLSTGVYTEDALSGGTNDSRAVTGASLNTYFLVPFSHVDSETGRPVYIDINGEETMTWDVADRRNVGDGLPNHILGLSNDFSYGNWELRTLFTGALGARIWDSSAKRQLGVVTDWNMRTDIFDRWRQPGDETQFPLLTLDETTYGLPSGFPWWNTDLFMYDADYVRLRNVTLSYRMPLAKGDVQLSVAGNNLFVITNFPGLDPELVRDFENVQDRNFSGGANYLTAPQERSVMFTINATF